MDGLWECGLCHKVSLELDDDDDGGDDDDDDNDDDDDVVVVVALHIKLSPRLPCCGNRPSFRRFTSIAIWIRSTKTN